jgi:hypothetical protein
MSAKLFNMNSDGACAQAKAILAFLNAMEGIESSYDGDKFTATPTVARWENCREQGYVICLRSLDFSRQLNIAFFEHRNSDDLCAIKWEQTTLNSPTIDTADFNGECYCGGKYDVSKSLPHGQIYEMAAWIKKELEKFWQSTK